MIFQDKKIRFIINPRSGSNKKKNIEKLIFQNFHNIKCLYDIKYTKACSHATELSLEAVSLRYDMVIALGGDGTINEIAKGLVNTNTALGIIPCGSGNGFARHLKIPQDMKKAIQEISKSKYSIVDTLQINDEFFLGIAGLGFDGHIAHLFADSKKRGFWSYARLVIGEFFRYKSKEYELIIDEKKISKKAFLLSFANSSQYGNDIIIAPNAKLDDGFFRLAILKPFPLWEAFNIFFKIRNGSIHKSKYYESHKCRQVVIKKQSLRAHMDGEPVFFEKEIKIKIYPKSLKILMPG